MAHFRQMPSVHPKNIEAHEHKEYHENAQGGNHIEVRSGYDGNELLKHGLIF